MWVPVQCDQHLENELILITHKIDPEFNKSGNSGNMLLTLKTNKVYNII